MDYTKYLQQKQYANESHACEVMEAVNRIVRYAHTGDKYEPPVNVENEIQDYAEEWALQFYESFHPDLSFANRLEPLSHLFKYIEDYARKHKQVGYALNQFFKYALDYIFQRQLNYQLDKVAKEELECA